jgi:hypothetical protein
MLENDSTECNVVDMSNGVGEKTLSFDKGYFEATLSLEVKLSVMSQTSKQSLALGRQMMRALRDHLQEKMFAISVNDRLDILNDQNEEKMQINLNNEELESNNDRKTEESRKESTTCNSIKFVAPTDPYLRLKELAHDGKIQKNIIM